MDNFTISHSLGLAAFISLLNPLDLAKNRLQTMPQLIANGNLSNSYKNPIHCLQIVKQTEGVKALWKGNALAISRFFPNEYLNVSIKKLCQSYLQPSITTNFASGVFGGWGAAFLLYPMDTIRILLTNEVQRSSGFFKIVRKRIMNFGIKSFYQGFSSSLIGVALFRGCFFGTYDSLKAVCQNKYQKCMAGYISCLFASFLTYPLDTARRRKIMRSSSKNVYKYCEQILKNEGIRGLYRGGSIVLIQSIVGSLVLLSLDMDSDKL